MAGEEGETEEQSKLAGLESISSMGELCQTQGDVDDAMGRGWKFPSNSNGLRCSVSIVYGLY